MKNINTFLVAILILTSCVNHRPKATQIEVKWNLIENNYQNQGRLLSEFIFINNSKYDLKSNWAFYFNTINTPSTDSASIVNFERINGDFYRMVPKNTFVLKPGDSCIITTYCANWVTSYTDAPNGGFFVFNNNEKEAEDVKIIEVGKIENLKQTTRRSDDKMPVETPELAYQKYSNYGIGQISDDNLLPIIPRPKKFTKSQGSFTFNENIAIYYQSDFKNEALFLANALKQNIGYKMQIKPSEMIPNEKCIFLAKGNTSNTEGYTLEIAENKIVIKASSNAGIFYGLQSLRALLPFDTYNKSNKNATVNCALVEDEPLFENRSIHLDVARNFQSKESVMKLIDLMALYKLNKLHFHFCDDEGWRIEIKSLPELTEIGAKRKFSTDPNILPPSFGSGAKSEMNSGSGYYTKTEFINILKYATERHIEIIPEIDLPGHSRAAIKSMNVRYLKFQKEGNMDKATEFLLRDLNDSSQYRSVQGWNDNVSCVCQESLYNFIDEVTRELKAMFDEAGAPLKTIHSGGDEVPMGVWEKSPLCIKFLKENKNYATYRELQSYFVSRFKKIMDKYNINTAGWEELVLKQYDGKLNTNKDFIGQNYIPYIWNNVWGWGMEDLTGKLSNAGFKVVLCNVTNLYFDMAYVKNPNEPGYYWGGYTDTRKFFEFTPFDQRNCAYEDNMGNTLNPIELFKGKELLADNARKNILGIEGLLWSENTKSPEMMEYMIFPKLLGLAERAWAQQPAWSTISDKQVRLSLLNNDWNVFANTLGQRELPKLDFYYNGIRYRIPVPAAIIKSDTLYAAIEFPGFELKYTTDGSEPSINSITYNKPVYVNGNVKLKTFAKNGRASRMVEVTK